MTKEELSSISNIFYSRALQVVVGCGADPTVYKDYLDVIKQAKDYSVPNVSMVTNGILLTPESIEKMSDLKLDDRVTHLDRIVFY